MIRSADPFSLCLLLMLPHRDEHGDLADDFIVADAEVPTPVAVQPVPQEALRVCRVERGEVVLAGTATRS